MPDRDRPPPPPPRPQKAVALRYDKARDPAPRVTASGRGAVAEQILELAFANGVKVREDADLVEILGAIDVDSPIPLEALAAVAEILAYVYRAEGRAPGAPRVPDNNVAPAASPVADRVGALFDDALPGRAARVEDDTAEPGKRSPHRRAGRFTPGEDWAALPKSGKPTHER